MIYNKADARNLLFNFSDTYPYFFKGRVASAALMIEVALKTIRANELNTDPLFIYPLYDYDFNTHSLVQCPEGTPSSLSGNCLLQAKAIRDYMAERARILAQECSIPTFPFALEFTTTYLQAKLLRDSNCKTIDEYVEKENLVHFGNRFRSFLQTVGDRFVTRKQKQIQKSLIIQQYNLQRVLAVTLLPPDDPKRIFFASLLMPSIPNLRDTFEPFVEFSLNNKKFAFFVNPIAADRVIIDMPNHSLFFFESIHAYTVGAIHGAAVFVFNKITSEIPGRCFVQAEDEVVIFSDETPHKRTCSLKGHPTRILDSEETAQFANTISSEIKKAVRTESFTLEVAMACLNSTALHVFFNIPFEYVRHKLSLPSQKTAEDFESDLNFNTRPILKYHNIPTIGNL